MLDGLDADLLAAIERGLWRTRAVNPVWGHALRAREAKERAMGGLGGGCERARDPRQALYLSESARGSAHRKRIRLSFGGLVEGVGAAIWRVLQLLLLKRASRESAEG